MPNSSTPRNTTSRSSTITLTNSPGNADIITQTNSPTNITNNTTNNTTTNTTTNTSINTPTYNQNRKPLMTTSNTQTNSAVDNSTEATFNTSTQTTTNTSTKLKTKNPPKFISPIAIMIDKLRKLDGPRCSKCFASHLPKPNSKLCMYDKKQSLNITSKAFKHWPVRMRGGANSHENKIDAPIIERGIANAKAHGIDVHAGVKNLANGNCAFESVLDSINTRECFEETFDGEPDSWRNIWMTEVEDFGYNQWHGGLSEAQWRTGWDALKMSRIYECQLGDLILPGISHCTKKDILIFNTSPLAHQPVYVVESSVLLNQKANTEIPICLAYDQSHYEMLVPDTEDIMKTIMLKQEVISGTTTVRMEDLFPLNSNNKESSSASKTSYAQVLRGNQYQARTKSLGNHYQNLYSNIYQSKGKTLQKQEVPLINKRRAHDLKSKDVKTACSSPKAKKENKSKESLLRANRFSCLSEAEEKSQESDVKKK